jgi:cytochrome oxidase assembly protein ShyY1
MEPVPARDDRPGIRAILTPAWLGVIALALAFAAASWAVLAPWQFGRNAERAARNAQITAALAAPAVPVADLLPIGSQPAPDSTWRSVTAEGTFIPERQVYVRLRQAYSQDASEVVVPFRVSDGSTVLVDRGYALATDLSAGRLPAGLPAGTVTITGRVSADQPDPSNRPSQTVAGRTEVYGIDSAVLAGDGARRGFVQLSTGSPGVLIPIPVPDRDSGPFLSYALQWCVFGAVALLAAGVFAYREVTVPVSVGSGVGSVGAGTGHGTGPSPAAPESSPGAARPAPAAARRPTLEKSQLYDR